LAASIEILIGDSQAQHVLIRPLSRKHPGLFDDLDGNWIDCELEIMAGGFRGAFRADLRTDEFNAFLEQVQGLIQAPDGSASFTTMEGQIAVFLTGDGKGTVRVHGEAVDEAGGDNRLEFAFDLNQTYLAPICQSLEHLLAAFPVSGPSAD
jgi:hypothetical protein